MDDSLLPRPDVRPVIPRPARRRNLAPDLRANLIDRHPHPVVVSPAASRVLQKERGHVAVYGRNPVSGLEPKQGADKDGLLIVRRVERAGEPTSLLLLD